jgi:hypothetical protein
VRAATVTPRRSDEEDPADGVRSLLRRDQERDHRNQREGQHAQQPDARAASRLVSPQQEWETVGCPGSQAEAKQCQRHQAQ